MDLVEPGLSPKLDSRLIRDREAGIVSSARLPESFCDRAHAVSLALTISTDLMEPSSPQGRVPGALPPLRLSIA